MDTKKTVMYLSIILVVSSGVILWVYNMYRTIYLFSTDNRPLMRIHYLLLLIDLTLLIMMVIMVLPSPTSMVRKIIIEEDD